MSLKDISYLELWKPLCSAKWNLLCNFGRRHQEEQFCEFFFLIWTSGSGGNVIKQHFLSRALAAPLFSEAEPFVQFW